MDGLYITNNVSIFACTVSFFLISFVFPLLTYLSPFVVVSLYLVRCLGGIGMDGWEIHFNCIRTGFWE